MKRYRVGVYEEQGGYAIVEAETPEEAEEKALAELSENGWENIDGSYYDTSISDKAVEF